MLCSKRAVSANRGCSEGIDEPHRISRLARFPLLSYVLIIASASAVLGWSSSAKADVALEKLAIDGGAIPAGSTFLSVQDGSINNNGEAVFWAEDGIDSEGVYLFSFSSGHSVIKIASKGDLLLSGGTIKKARWPTINDAGEIVFVAEVSQVSRGSTSHTSIIRYSKGKLEELVKDGDSAPFLGGGTFQLGGFDPRGTLAFTQAMPTLADSGDIGFTARMREFPGIQGVFIYSSGVITKVVASNEPTPIVGTSYESLSAPVVTDDNRAIFNACLNPNPSGLLCDGKAGIFSYDRSSSIITKLVATGDLIPGGVLTFRNAKAVSFSANDTGQTVFAASLGTDSQGIFVHDSSSGLITKVVVEGDSTPAGEIFNSLSLSHPVINHAGQVAFRAFVGPRELGGLRYFISSGGAIKTLVHAGLETEEGLLVRDIAGDFPELNPPPTTYFNDAGVVALRLVVKKPISGDVVQGLFVAKPFTRKDSLAIGATAEIIRIFDLPTIFYNQKINFSLTIDPALSPFDVPAGCKNEALKTVCNDFTPRPPFTLRDLSSSAEIILEANTVSIKVSTFVETLGGILAGFRFISILVPFETWRCNMPFEKSTSKFREIRMRAADLTGNKNCVAKYEKFPHFRFFL